MIFTKYGDDIFFIDLLLHIEYSFIIFALIFVIMFRKTEEDRLKDTLSEVLKTNIFDGLSNSTVTDKTNLENLKKVYNNHDKADNSMYYLKKYGWTSAILVGAIILLVLLHIKIHTDILSFIFNKTLLFIGIFCGIYLQEKLVKENYKEFFEKDLYDMINDRIENLN